MKPESDKKLPSGSDGKESACNAMRVTHVQSLGQEDPKDWRERQPTPVFLPGEFHGQKSLEGYSPWGLIESNMAEWETL